MNKVLLNLIIFQSGWFVCVKAGNLSAALYVVVALLVHQIFFIRDQREWLLIAAFALGGFSLDALLVSGGVLIFSSVDFFNLPIWMFCLWLLFAMTLNHCFVWLHKRLRLASLLAAFIGPLNYLIGTKISDVQMAQPVFQSLAIMACAWAFLFPLGLYWAGRLNHE